MRMPAGVADRLRAAHRAVRIAARRAQVNAAWRFSVAGSIRSIRTRPTRAILALAREGDGAQVVTLGTEMVVHAQRDHAFRAIVNACALSLCDTVGVLAVARRRGAPLRERVTGVELIERLCAGAAAQALPVYFLGGAAGVAAEAAASLAVAIPAVARRRHARRLLSRRRNAQVVSAIAASGARLLFGGPGLAAARVLARRQPARDGMRRRHRRRRIVRRDRGSHRARAAGWFGSSAWSGSIRLAQRTAALAAPARAAALRLARRARRARPCAKRRWLVKAMILAGGLSTRLYPLTKHVPKPLVPVAGVPNAAHLIRYLKALRIRRDRDQRALPRRRDRRHARRRFALWRQAHYSHEPELLGSAGGVKKIEDFFGDETFLVIGCDEVTDLRLDRLVEFHRDRDAIATIGLVECDEVDQYGVVVLDDRGKIVGFQEKPAKGTELSKLANTGVYVFAPEIFEHIPAGEFYDFGKQVFPALQGAGERFYGFDARGAYWADIGTPSEYRARATTSSAASCAFPIPCADGIDPTATLARGVRIEGPVRIGAGAVVADGVTIVGPSVLGERVRVDAGARLERAILWEGATIGCSCRRCAIRSSASATPSRRTAC